MIGHMTEPLPHRITLYQGDNGRWRWRRQAGNNRIVASSEQGFRRRRYAEKDATRDLPAGLDYVIVILP